MPTRPRESDPNPRPDAPDRSRVVRVFISSTFRDFQQERDLLMKRVFPELRRRARDRFVEVIGVDLRWGITERESERGETLPICLREIERSRPYFIGLLGERYGWTPQAGHYPESLLEQQPWLREHAGGKSVTELEVLHGVLNDPSMAGRAFFYFRDAAYAQGRGVDFASEGDSERARLASLKQRIRGSPFPVSDFPNPEALADLVTEHLWKLIDAEYPADAVPDELERQRRSHEAYALERRRVYVGQEETVASLLDRLQNASDEPGEKGSGTRITLITGESGSGKSALIANVMAQHRQHFPNDVVIEHYIGSTSEASDPMHLMRRVAEQIKRLTQSTAEIESDDERLIEQFATWIAEGAHWARRRGGSLVLALDALDKLESRAQVRWLPRIVPPHARIVASAIPGESLEALRGRKVDEIAVPRFSKAIARKYIVETLARRSRRLPAAELDRITAHPGAKLPIFLKTLVDELAVFGSHEGLPGRITQCLKAEESGQLFQLILERIESDIGRNDVQKPLEAIWASSDGMSEEELVDFTGVAPLALARLRLALDEALYDSGGLVRLSHAYIARGVADRYRPRERDQRALHRDLGLWWEGREPSSRMARQLRQRLTAAAAWDDLLRCLVTARTAFAMLDAIQRHSLYQSWREIARHRGADSVTKFIEERIAEAWPVWRTALGKEADAVARLIDINNFLGLTGIVGALANDAAALCVEVARAGCAAAGLTPKSRRRLSVALLYQARVEEDRFDLAKALSMYEESLEIARALAEELGTPLSRRDVAIILASIGECVLKHDDFLCAMLSYGEALDVFRGLVEQFDSPAFRQDLSLTLVKVGSLQEERRDLDAALAKYSESLAIRRDLAAEFGTPRSRRDASVSLAKVADIEHARGDIGSALKKYLECLAIDRDLAAEFGTPQSRRDLSVGLKRVADIEHAQGDIGSALKKCVECLAIDRDLAAEFGAPVSRRDLSVSLCMSAGIEQSRGDLDTALSMCCEALEIRSALCEEVGTPETMFDLGACLTELADIQRHRLEIDEALLSYGESLEIFRALAGESGRPMYREALGTTLTAMIAVSAVWLECLLQTGQTQDLHATLASSRSWVTELQSLDNLSAGHAGILAAWWEQAAAVHRAQGNAPEADTAEANARHWRERERALRVSQASGDAEGAASA